MNFASKKGPRSAADGQRRARMSPRARWIALFVAFAALSIAAVATANVILYNNGFSNKGRYKQIVGSNGKKCGRTYRSKAKKMKVKVKRGSTFCAYSPPIEGSTPLPNHDIRFAGKFLTDHGQTPRSQQFGAYLAAEVRAGRKQNYQLIVKPKSKRWFLYRHPDNGQFPKKGRTKKHIHRLGKTNFLRIRAFRTRVAAYVNGHLLARVRDNNPGDVTGKRMYFGLGNQRENGALPITGVLDNVEVQLPSP